MNIKAIFLTLIYLVVSPFLYGDYYVSTTGSDSNPGTISQPFATIQKAADVATYGDTVYIRGGVYRETVQPVRSGQFNNPIVYSAYNDEEVVISAGDLVTGWTNSSGDIWKATVDWDNGTDGAGNTVFVDGELKFEAREGAETDPMDLDDWKLVAKGKIASTYLYSSEITGWGDDYWNGAKIRHLVNDWTITTSTISDYNSSDGKFTFESSVGTISQKHIAGCYIYDTIKALDRAGEWYKDSSTDTLYYQVPSGKNPSNYQIEFKKRNYGFNLDSRSYIQIKGLTFRGCSIETNTYTDNNLIDGNKFYGYDKWNYGRFWINGDNNVFSSNEVSQTWGSVFTISGTGNTIINNYFHDIGYFGTSRVVSMSGSGHLVAYNTISKIARSFLDGFPYRSEFAYNIFEDGANLSWDTGFFDGDSGNGNGGGCIIHHNVFRNTDAIGIFMSIYAGIDQVIHHNIIYGMEPDTLRASQLNFIKYYHNTIIGDGPYGNTNAGSFAFEANYNNNLQITADKITSIGINCRGNYNYSESDFANFSSNDFRLAAGSGAIDKGIILPGINDDYVGELPDAGALEYGQEMWKVGHDFATPPTYEYSWEQLPGTNIFENSQFSLALSGWSYTNTPTRINGNSWNATGTGLSRLGVYSVEFNPDDSMYRVFTGLKPNTWYTVATETRLVDELIQCEQYSSKSGDLTTGDHRGENYVTGLSEGEWVKYNNIDFGDSGKYNQMEITYTRPAGTTYGSDSATLEVRIGSETGQLLGTFEYNANTCDTWRTVQIDLPDVSGSQNVYLLPLGENSEIIMQANVRLLNTNIKPDDKFIAIAKDAGPTDIVAYIGDPYWRGSYETFMFKTGASNTSVKLIFRNDGNYNAYLDRLALYEDTDPTEMAGGTATQSSTAGDNVAANALDGDYNTVATTEDLPDSFWQLDLGENKDIYNIKMTSPVADPGQMRNICVSIWNRTPGDGEPIWQQNYCQDSYYTNSKTILIKGTDYSIDGTTMLQEAYGRYVRIQLAGTNMIDDNTLGLAEVEVSTFDEMDIVQSDGEESQDEQQWKASFAQIINIGQIELENVATDNYKELSNFNVSVWDAPEDEGGEILWQKNFFTSGSVGKGAKFVISGNETSIDGKTRLASVLGRIVKIKNNGTNYAGNTNLSLANAKIYDSVDAMPTDNVAIWGEAEQETDNYASSDTADYAINSIVIPSGDMTHTQYSYQPWWQVDLKQTPTFDQIVLYNRTDAGERIGNFRVSIWDGNPNEGASELWGKNYSFYNGDLPEGGSLSIDRDVTSDSGTRLDEVVGGQFVRVQLLGTNFLSLVEVQVWKATELECDFNEDSIVNLPDFALLSDCWLSTREETTITGEGTFAYWPANSTTGTVLTDLSGNGYDGTLYNGASWSGSGKYEQGLSFDGYNDYVKINQSDIGDGFTEITLSVWFNPDAKGANDGVITSYIENQYEGYFGFLLSGYGEGYPAEFRAMGKSLLAPDYSAPTGEWTHAVGVWKAGQIHKLYLNGVEVASSETPPSGSINLDNWYIGTDRGISGRYFNGIIDEVRMYNYAMTAEQVNDLYYIGAEWKCQPYDIDSNDTIDLSELTTFIEEWLSQI